MSLERFIKFIKEGEPVAPGTPNRPLRQLDQNIQYLWDVIQAANLGSTVYAREVTVESTAELGMPVYWNSSTSSFDRAIAKMETDSTTGYIKTSDSSQVWGIVAEKHEATLADILLFGYAPVDISAATDSSGAVPAGTYYLSGTGVGKLVLQKPPVSVPVLRADGSGNVYVNPSFMDFLENHQHYKFDLTMLRAGDTTAPAEGAIHTITSADPTLTGWLPADDATFNGNAPANAKFGYNINVEPGLKNLYPPIPLESADVELLRPSIYDWHDSSVKLRERLAGQALSDLVVLDRNGIWWMSNCYDQVPWPTDYTTGNSLSYSPYDCPPDAVPAMLLYFTKVNFATDQSVVSSLTSVDTRLKIYCAGSTTAQAVGDLDIDLDLQFVTTENQPGYKVLKALDGETFTRGAIAEGVYAASSNVSLYAIDNDGVAVPSETVDGKTVYRGNVGITVSSSLTQDLGAQIVRLDGVTEEHSPVLYLGMPDGYATSYTVKFDVPADAAVGSNFKFRIRVLGRAAATLPPLAFSYNKSTRPSSGTPQINPVPDSALVSISDITTNTTTIATADSAVEFTQATGITVNPGDIIYIQVARDPTDAGDTYGGEVGIMQQTGVLS